MLQRVAGDPPAAAVFANAAARKYSLGIGHGSDTGGAAPESERLARQIFALFQERDKETLLELIHPEVEVVLETTGPGEVLAGRDAVAELVDSVAGRLCETQAVEYPLDDNRIMIEGRLRSLDDERILRDDPMIWAFEFREGLLRLPPSRYWPRHPAALGEACLAPTSARQEN